MAKSKADRMKEAAQKQLNDHEEKGVFAGMKPIQDQEPEQAPAKKRGRPKKAETVTKEYAPTYAASKEEEERKKREGRTISATVTKEEPQPPKKLIVTYTDHKKEEPKQPQKKSDGKAAFSVWMTKATAEEVKQYSAITGEKMTDICEAALTEYLKNHAPTKKQKEEYRKRELERINNI